MTVDILISFEKYSCSYLNIMLELGVIVDSNNLVVSDHILKLLPIQIVRNLEIGKLCSFNFQCRVSILREYYFIFLSNC